jgi:hypothetical protein
MPLNIATVYSRDINTERFYIGQASMYLPDFHIIPENWIKEDIAGREVLAANNASMLWWIRLRLTEIWN